MSSVKPVVKAVENKVSLGHPIGLDNLEERMLKTGCLLAYRSADLPSEGLYSSNEKGGYGHGKNT